MCMGRDCQFQGFLSLGLESQSSKFRDRPNDFRPSPKSPRDLCPMRRLWDSQNSSDCFGHESHGTPKSRGTRVQSGPKDWDLAVQEIFVPGLSQRYVSVPSVPRESVPIPVPLPIRDGTSLVTQEINVERCRLFWVENWRNAFYISLDICNVIGKKHVFFTFTIFWNLSTFLF